ncbi:MAG: hypothetical protein U0Y82_01790 [Thermoleophilia bacterium]
MHNVQAHALRRVIVMAAALIATLGAHALTGCGLQLMRAAPFSWGAMLSLAALLGTRRGTFRARTPVGTLCLLVLLEAAMHVALTEAPWLFGIHAGHEVALASVTALIVHGAVAFILAPLVWFADQLLDAALGILQRLGRAIAGDELAPCHEPRFTVSVDRLSACAGWFRSDPAPRGPPLRAVLLGGVPAGR